MKAYLMTRGTTRRNDYQFLGAEPPEQWWEPLAQQVVLEEPEVVAARRGDRFGVLLSGLPSARRDVIGTALRYTVVVDDLADEPELLCRLVATALTDSGRRQLGALLDKRFGDGLVDAVLDGSETVDVPEVVGTAVRALPETAVPQEENDFQDSWVGPIESDRARQAFLGRVAWLAREGNGYAFTSHLLSSARGAATAAGRLDGDVAILLVEGDVSEVTVLGKAPALPPVAERGRKKTLVLAAAGLVLLGVLGWIAWYGLRNHLS
jgi:hypothetical protein